MQKVPMKRLERVKMKRRRYLRSTNDSERKARLDARVLELFKSGEVDERTGIPCFLLRRLWSAT
jgi:hypothetical protein